MGSVANTIIDEIRVGPIGGIITILVVSLFFIYVFPIAMSILSAIASIIKHF